MAADGRILECATIIFRAARSKGHVSGSTPRRFTSGAFLLRPAERGLSVNSACNPEQCGADLSKRYGVASLHVGHVSTLALQVEADDIGPPPHAEITGLPQIDVNEVEAERLAGALAEQARIVIDRVD